MKHKCKNSFINDCGGEIHCDVCGSSGFFTEFGITAKALINSGGYNEPDKDGKIIKYVNDTKEIYFNGLWANDCTNININNLKSK